MYHNQSYFNMRIIRQIEFTGKNLNDIFNLPCVWKILKGLDKKPVVVVYNNMLKDQNQRLHDCCYVGDFLVEFENGQWAIIRP